MLLGLTHSATPNLKHPQPSIPGTEARGGGEKIPFVKGLVIYL